MTLEYQCICGACKDCLAAIQRYEDSVIRDYEAPGTASEPRPQKDIAGHCACTPTALCAHHERYPGSRPEFAASPLPEEPPAELSTLIDEMMQAFGEESGVQFYPLDMPRYRAARARVASIVDGQREWDRQTIGYWYKRATELESQLERNNQVNASLCEGYEARITALSERLKAEQQKSKSGD